MGSSWHSRFNPQQFLRGVHLERLLRRNEVFEGNGLVAGSAPCVICGNVGGSVLVLNDRRVVCKDCFERLSLIQYPELYETAWRDYRRMSEATSQARQLLTAESVARRLSSTAGTIGSLSLALSFWKSALLAVSMACFVIWRFSKKAYEASLAEWDQAYPAPKVPELRHFHDPQAQLSDYDRKVLSVFDHWPGYPPYWDYLRAVVASRDGHHCQVSGCPSRVSLHIHHMQPISRGGAHSPENLVALCDFHHALEPEAGHERVWGRVKTRFFTLVREHLRSNPVNPGTHLVCAHLRRLELVTQEDLREISSYYGFACSACASPGLRINVSQPDSIVIVECPACQAQMQGPRQLAEVTGPLLAERLLVTQNAGRWKAHWETLAGRTGDRWGAWSPSAAAKRRGSEERHRLREDHPACPVCGAPMRVVLPAPAHKWKAFWGCPNYKATGCRGSAPYHGKRPRRRT
jgi:5-methylcytosine-specific restriction endonuclease McrA